MMFLSRRRNPKSRLNLSCKNPTTTSYGALIPTNITRVVAGDDFSYQPSSYLQAMPLLAPRSVVFLLRRNIFLFRIAFIMLSLP